MAENYIVVPLDEQTASDLTRLGVPHPPPPVASRGPRPAEVFATLSEVADLEQQVYPSPGRQRIIVHVSARGAAGRHTEVQLFGVAADGAPCRLSFRGGSFRLVQEITAGVARRCGPLVIYPASGADPVVCPGSGGTTEPSPAPDPGGM